MIKKKASETLSEKVKKSGTLSHYEEEAEKFEPSEDGAGTLLRAKRDIEHVLNLKSLTPETFNEGEVGLVIYELTHSETGERAMIMLKDETRIMHISSEFDKDYKVIAKGTSKMEWSIPEDGETEEGDKVDE